MIENEVVFELTRYEGLYNGVNYNVATKKPNSWERSVFEKYSIKRDNTMTKEVPGKSFFSIWKFIFNKIKLNIWTFTRRIYTYNIRYYR